MQMGDSVLVKSMSTFAQCGARSDGFTKVNYLTMKRDYSIE